jgi:hypothetical protein
MAGRIRTGAAGLRISCAERDGQMTMRNYHVVLADFVPASLAQFLPAGAALGGAGRNADHRNSTRALAYIHLLMTRRGAASPSLAGCCA